MREVKILILEDSDSVSFQPGIHHFVGATRQPLYHADIAIEVRKNGETRLIKSRQSNGSVDGIADLVEELSLAYAEGKL